MAKPTPTPDAVRSEERRKVAAVNAVYELHALLKMAATIKFSDPEETRFATHGVLIRSLELTGALMSIVSGTEDRTADDLEAIVYGNLAGAANV